MTALWAELAAERFWAAAGGPPSAWPRDLRRAIAAALPLAVVDLPCLRGATLAKWLSQRGITLPLAHDDRSLRACLIVRNGSGLIFLDGTDPDDERRFSLAHEVAHFLGEYVLPRERAAARLGTDILPVLEGRRAAEPAERFHAILAGVSLETHWHLLERTPEGHYPGEVHSAAESRADDLAIELLAPVAAARARVIEASAPADRAAILRATFGLPAAVARVYAHRLGPEPPGSGWAVSLLRSLCPPRET